MANESIQYGIVSPEEAQKLSGLELMQGLIDRKYPAPPIAQTLDFTLAEVEKGRAVFVGTPHYGYYNPLGTVHGGYIATLLDSALGCSIHTTLAAGQSYTTLEIKVNYVRPILANTGQLWAEGKVINVGRRVATSEATLKDKDGKLYAHATTTCLVFEF